jgi:hypothetical protein
MRFDWIELALNLRLRRIQANDARNEREVDRAIFPLIENDHYDTEYEHREADRQLCQIFDKVAIAMDPTTGFPLFVDVNARVIRFHSILSAFFFCSNFPNQNGDRWYSIFKFLVFPLILSEPRQPLKRIDQVGIKHIVLGVPYTLVNAIGGLLVDAEQSSLLRNRIHERNALLI